MCCVAQQQVVCRVTRCPFPRVLSPRCGCESVDCVALIPRDIPCYYCTTCTKHARTQAVLFVALYSYTIEPRNSSSLVCSRLVRDMDVCIIVVRPPPVHHSFHFCFLIDSGRPSGFISVDASQTNGHLFRISCLIKLCTPHTCFYDRPSGRRVECPQRKDLIPMHTILRSQDG